MILLRIDQTKVWKNHEDYDFFKKTYHGLIDWIDIEKDLLKVEVGNEVWIVYGSKIQGILDVAKVVTTQMSLVRYIGSVAEKIDGKKKQHRRIGDL